MRRSTRTTLAGITIGEGFPPPYQSVVSQTDLYTRSLNIKPLIIQLPFSQDSQHDLEGIKMRLQRNRSFMKSQDNPQPPEFPKDLQKQDLGNIGERIHMLMESLLEPRPGLLVMLLQPPEGVDFRQSKEIQEARPICGVVIRVGAGGDEPRNHSNQSYDKSKLDHEERSIIGAFCRRNVPPVVAEELLCVTLIRAIVEAICFEEVAAKAYDLDNLIGSQTITSESGGDNGGSASRISLFSPSPSLVETPTRGQMSAYQRERRFISINTSDLPLCPTVLVKCIRDTLRFVGHIDREIEFTGHAVIEHMDDPNRECKCWKVYRKELSQQLQRHKAEKPSVNVQTSLPNSLPLPSPSSSSCSTSSSTSSSSPSLLDRTHSNGFYQFWILSAKRIKAGSLLNALPREPSHPVIEFCLGSRDRYLAPDLLLAQSSSLNEPVTSLHSSTRRKRKGSVIDGDHNFIETPRKKEKT